MFDSPNLGLFVFCERVREEAVHWERRHEDALECSFMNGQGRKEVPWTEIPQDFEEWDPKKKRGKKGFQ